MSNRWRLNFLKITGNQMEPTLSVADFEVKGPTTKLEAVKLGLEIMERAGVQDDWDKIDVRNLAPKKEGA